MIEVMKSIIVRFFNGVRQLKKPNKKAPTINVTITISSGDNNKVDVHLNK